MAKRGIVLSGRSDLGNDLNHLRKPSKSAFTRLHNLMRPFVPIDSGDAALVVVKRSHERRSKVFAMASRLGIAEGRRERIRRNPAIQRIFENLRRMHENQTKMWASASIYFRENARIDTQAYAEAILHCVAVIFLLPIYRVPRDAPIHRLDFPSVRNSNRRQLGHCLGGTVWGVRHHCLCNNCQIRWQKGPLHWLSIHRISFELCIE